MRVEAPRWISVRLGTLVLCGASGLVACSASVNQPGGGAGGSAGDAAGVNGSVMGGSGGGAGIGSGGGAGAGGAMVGAGGAGGLAGVGGAGMGGGAGTAGESAGGSAGAGGAATNEPCGPVRAEWPTPMNTGVPAGTVLNSMSSMNITKDGTVLDGVDIANGCITISANNVTIRRSRIRKNCYYPIQVDSSMRHTGILVEDTELYGVNDTSGEGSIVWQDYTLCRVYVHDVGEAARAAANSFIQDSYFGAPFHDNNGIPAGSTDPVVLRHNTIETKSNGKAWTGLVMIDTAHGIPTNIVIENNLLIGGAWAIVASGALNIRIVDNHISNKLYPKGGEFGAIDTSMLMNATISGNVWHESGAPVP